MLKKDRKILVSSTDETASICLSSVPKLAENWLETDGQNVIAALDKAMDEFVVLLVLGSDFDESTDVMQRDLVLCGRKTELKRKVASFCRSITYF